MSGNMEILLSLKQLWYHNGGRGYLYIRSYLEYFRGGEDSLDVVARSAGIGKWLWGPGEAAI
jgi:hypothetical protein